MDGNKYLTNNNVGGSGGTPTFKQNDAPSTAQEWKISIDANGKKCYKITSKADGRYLNEYGVFGTNAYYSDWNTYLITRMGDSYSLRWTQSAAKNGAKYIVVSGDKLEAKDVDQKDSYTVNIIRKGDATSIGATSDNKAQVRYDASSGSIICTNVADGSHITVASVSGSTVCSTTAYGNCAVLPVGSQPSGLYIITLRNDKETKSYKILKQ
jgi:hypothetical protein